MNWDREKGWAMVKSVQPAGVGLRKVGMKVAKKAVVKAAPKVKKMAEHGYDRFLEIQDSAIMAEQALKKHFRK